MNRRRLCFSYVAGTAVIFFLVLNIAAEAQEVWNSQVDVNSPAFDCHESLQPGASINCKTTFHEHIAAPHANGDFDVPRLEMGIDEVTVEPDLSAVGERGRLAPLATMFTMGIAAPIQERGSHAASVTVAQLEVPAKAHKALQKALQAVRKRRRDEARAEVEAALAIWPRYSDALILYALLYLGDSQLDPAIAAAEEAVKLDGTNGMAYIVLAGAHNSKGQYDDALHALERALRFRPDAWQGYVERARAAMGKGAFTAALADANRAGELAPAKTPVIYLLKGAAFLSLNRRSEAILELQAYLRTNPGGVAADRVRSMIERTLATP
jgi:tetratricopeptide (TPR) repeat protein